MTERERKLERVLAQLRRELEEEKGYDESFTGKLSFEFNIQTGGISGTIGITKIRKPIAT